MEWLLVAEGEHWDQKLGLAGQEVRLAALPGRAAAAGTKC